MPTEHDPELLARAEEFLAAGWSYAKTAAMVGISPTSLATRVPGYTHRKKPHHHISDRKVQQLRDLYRQGYSQKEAAEITGVPRDRIRARFPEFALSRSEAAKLGILKREAKKRTNQGSGYDKD